WEADTVAGQTGKACLVTLVDRKSRLLLIGKSENKASKPVVDQMIKLLQGIDSNFCKTITPDRGKEFSQHARLTEELNNTQIYFPDPHAPWQRGSNENTNGLLREYSPKSVDLTDATDEEIQGWATKLNTRPKKCLNWKTPYEIFYKTVLHLI
uniref:IS30 family transposase n=1 Tax=Bavariicoccus seileri TaxID=549685 RepID=UPI0003B508E4